MRRRIGPAALPAMASLATVWASSTTAQQSEPPPPRTPSLIVFGLGPVYRPDLHDIDPSGSPLADRLGRFHTSGVTFEFAYQRWITRWGNVDVLAVHRRPDGDQRRQRKRDAGAASRLVVRIRGSSPFSARDRRC